MFILKRCMCSSTSAFLMLESRREGDLPGLLPLLALLLRPLLAFSKKRSTGRIYMLRNSQITYFNNPDASTNLFIYKYCPTLMDCSSGDLESKDLKYKILTRETRTVSITLFGSILRINEMTASLISESISCSLEAPAFMTAAKTYNMTTMSCDTQYNNP